MAYAITMADGAHIEGADVIIPAKVKIIAASTLSFSWLQIAMSFVIILMTSIFFLAYGRRTLHRLRRASDAICDEYWHSESQAEDTPVRSIEVQSSVYAQDKHIQATRLSCIVGVDAGGHLPSGGKGARKDGKA